MNDRLISLSWSKTDPDNCINKSSIMILCANLLCQSIMRQCIMRQCTVRQWQFFFGVNVVKYISSNMYMHNASGFSNNGSSCAYISYIFSKKTRVIL